jgi:diguanylate cyclase (GGDEF)-like protein/PAS domain S-box-containing protein
VKVALVALGYCATAKGGLAFATDSASITAIWAPTGIALVAIVIWGPRMWPAVALGAMLANAGTGVAPLVVVAIAAGNTLEALIGARLLRLAGFRPSLERLRDVILLIVLAATLSTVVGATIGVASLSLGGALDSGQAASAWLTWWIGDMGGDLLVAPLGFVLAMREPRPWPHPRRVIAEALALALAAVALSAIAFSQRAGLVFLTFPIFVWAAVRFRQLGATVASLVITSVAVALTVRGFGPFHGADRDGALLLAQLFGGVAAMAALVLAVITSERERALANLRRSHDELEQKVHERTAALTGAQARIAARHEVAPIGSWEWDLASREVTWSHELYEIFGVPDEGRAPTYDGYLELLHPDDRPQIRATIERAAVDGMPYTVEHRIIRPDGTVRTLACAGQVLTGDDGRPVRMLGIGQDVTDSQRADAALRESQERTRLIVDAASHAFVSCDEQGVITDWNPAAERLLGYRRDEALGRMLEQTIVPERDRAEHRGGMGRFVATGDSTMLGRPIEFDALHRRGHLIPVELTGSAIKTQAGYSFSAFLQDISERMRAKRLLATEAAVGQALLESASLEEARPRVLEHIGLGLGWAYGGWWSQERREGGLRRDALWYSTALDTARFERANRATTRSAGSGLPGWVWESGKPLVISDLAAGARGERRRAAAAAGFRCAIGLPIVCHGEVVAVIEFLATEPLHLNDDTTAMMERLADGVARYVERERFEDKLQHLADHDGLTDLFNHRRFHEELAREVAAAERYGTRGAVLALDLDNLKHVNDTLGHEAGNQLIARVAELVGKRLRKTDILARIGGDEFAAILPNAGWAQARQIAGELLCVIREQAILNTPRGSCRTSASIGITVFGRGSDQSSGEDLLTEADMAMYDAKQAGRDRVHSYDPGSARQLRRTWAQQIREALADDRFTLHAQPIVALGDAGGTRHELLVRMIGTGGDLIAPAMFLSTAERLNLVQELDRWVVRQAIALLVESDRDGRDDRFSVNLSALSMADPQLPTLIARELATSGADPAGLTFEVTETAAINDFDRARTFVHKLGELGCSFALDDFGTGFASFYNLKHLPFDELKIDGEFIDHLPDSRANQLIVRSVVEIARGLGKRTVAECVGDDATVELLRSYGVDSAQGYHLGRPVPVEALCH